MESGVWRRDVELVSARLQKAPCVAAVHFSPEQKHIGDPFVYTLRALTKAGSSYRTPQLMSLCKGHEDYSIDYRCFMSACIILKEGQHESTH